MAMGSRLATSLRGGNKDESESNRLTTNMFNEESPAKKNLLVFIVGGVTLLEIAAFRYLSNEPNFPFRIIVASTKLINGSNFVENMQHLF
jgi:hypothetical protein